MRFQVGLSDIIDARETIKEVVRKTPLGFSTTFSDIVGHKVFFKYENLQKTGSFKIRGAYNRIAGLSENEKKKGVIAASAGNHAQGVAYAAAKAGISSTIVMPEGVPIVKLMAAKGYGARVVLSGQSYDEAYMDAERLQKESGGTLIHAFNDRAVIAGQGTIGLELIEKLPDIDTVLVPIGGGGLASGIALALKNLNPKVSIVGVQAEGAPSMKQSLDIGHIGELDKVSTIADGIAVKHPGELTFPIIQQLVDEIVLVNDEEISQAVLMMLERSKVVCEGAGAVGVAALLSKRVKRRNNTVVIISGGNMDVHTLSIIIERGLIKAGRFFRFRTVVDDRPGTLQQLLSVIAELRANVISISHDRFLPSVPITRSEVLICLETRDRAHTELISASLSGKGYLVNKEEYE